MRKIYLLIESKTLNTYTDKKEAIADRDNNRLWYPENNYKIIEQKLNKKGGVKND